MTTMGPDSDRDDERTGEPKDERPVSGEGPEGRRHLLAAAMEVVAAAGSAAAGSGRGRATGGFFRSR
jgi:hypothetical protein